MPNSQVKAVYLAARHLKMDRVVKECTRHLIKNLNVENCIETRSLPGIARNKAFVEQVDTFIAKEVWNFGQYHRAAGAWGSVVVKALGYKSVGPGIDSRR